MADPIRTGTSARTRFITSILLILLAFKIAMDVLARRRAALAQAADRDTQRLVR
jgi:hypothetical protein